MRKELQVTTRLGKVAVQQGGPESGPPVVLIPGLTLNAADWPRTMIGELHKLGYRTLALDLPDSAHSERVLGDYSADRFCGAVQDAIEGLRLAEFHLVGMSLGGLVLQRMKRPAGRLLSTTFLMSCACTYPLTVKSSQSVAKLMKVPLNISKEVAFYHGLACREYLAGTATEHDLRELRDRVFRSVERAWPYGSAPHRQVRVAMEILGGPRPDFRHWTHPTLIIHGEKDPLLPLWSARALHGQIPGSRMETIPGMGHELLARYAESLVGCFSHFLAQTRQSQAS